MRFIFAWFVALTVLPISVTGYDEIETQLHRIWKHSSAELEADKNPCLRSSFRFADERQEDAFITNFINSIQDLSGGVSKPRQRATGLLAKAALVLPTLGDFAETGLNAGSTACIMMLMLLRFDNCGRKFWGFDSFAGLPNNITAEDGVWGVAGKGGDMAVSQERFETNMKRWGAWNDSRIVISKGYFSETLPVSHVDKISFLRLDGDIFVSTWEALEFLYHKVVAGGYIYVDDYGSFEGCREAVDKFRAKHQIYEPIHYIREENQVKYIMFEAVWWKKR